MTVEDDSARVLVGLDVTTPWRHVQRLPPGRYTVVARMPDGRTTRHAATVTLTADAVVPLAAD